MSVQKPLSALETEPVGSLLTKYALPAIIAMTAVSLYNMVDSIFIGRGVGAMAISGLAITFPFMNIAAAFGALVGVGASTIVSVRLGQKNYGAAQQVLGNVVCMNIVIGGVFTLVSLIFIDPILYFFGAGEQTIGYARDYIVIILSGNIITHLYLGLNSVLRSSGHPIQAMMMTVTTVVLNTALDPLFIFVFGWGIQGAAVATVLSQCVTLMWLLILFSDKKRLLHFRKGMLKPRIGIIKDILAIGMAPFLMHLASCMIVILINNGLKRYGGDLAIGAYGIVNRFAFMFLMIVMGLNQGMQPNVGYNYGARQINRVQKAFRLTVFFATLVTTFAFLLAQLKPEWIARVFTTDEELIRLSVYGMRISVMVFPLIGAQMVITHFFQSIGMAKKAIFLSLIRQVIVLIPCLLIMPKLFGIAGIWMSMPVSDTVSALVSIAMIYVQLRKFKAKQ